MDPINEINMEGSRRHWMLGIVMNVLVLVELCLSMDLAVSSTEDFTATFIKVFFGKMCKEIKAGSVWHLHIKKNKFRFDFLYQVYTFLNIMGFPSDIKSRTIFVNY